MASWIAVCADGRWLTAERLRTYPLIMVVMTAVAAGVVLVAGNGVLPSGAPFGSDFVSYWIAAREALAGNPLVPYDRALFEPAQAALFPEAGFSPSSIHRTIWPTCCRWG